MKNKLLFYPRFLWLTIIKNPFKLIMLLIAVSSFNGCSDDIGFGEIDQVTTKKQAYRTIVLVDENKNPYKYLVITHDKNEDFELTEFKKEPNIKEDGYLYIEEFTELQYLCGLALVISLLLFVLLPLSDDGEGRWDFGDIRTECWTKEITSDREDGFIYVIFRGKIISKTPEEEEHYRSPLNSRSIQDSIKQYLKYPNLCEDYKGDATVRRGDKLKDILG